MTKPVHLYASQRVSRRAKDGSDGSSVTIISKSVTYQISASGTEAPTGSWSDKVVLTTDTKPYLWTRTIVVYSDTNSTTSYSVSYRGKDGTNGTSFTPKGMADGYYSKATEIPAYSDEQNGKIYLVDDATNVTSPFIVPDAPYVAQYVLHDGEYVLFLVHAEFGDGYNVGGHLFVANATKWVDFGEIQGAKGDKGEDGMDGKDAINIVFSPAELVFDADENGNLIQAEKSAEIKVYRGTTELQYKTDWDNDAEIGDNCWAALLVNTTTNKPEVKISGITSSNIDDVKVPATSGGANVSVIVDGVKYRAYLPFSVNVNTYANFLIRDNKKYISKYTEVSNKYTEVSKELDNKANKNDMEEKISTISQKADNIKLEVLSKTSGRRNMLVNSAFRNQDSVFIHSLARIEKNTGLDGVNCIHSSDKYSGTGDGNYIGAFWDSTQKNGVVTNIPIRVGKKYVISCWIKSDNKDLPFVIECFFMNSISQQNRGEYSIRKKYYVDKVNEWKRIDFVVDTTDTSEYASKVTPYLAVNFWSNTKNVPKATGATEYPTCHAYICKPMMAEGDTYGGWTLSEDDYEYVGGNILDNTRSLEKSGNLEKEDSEIINEGYEYAYAVAHSNNTTSTDIEMLQWNVAGRINDGQDYMFSFLANGTGMVSTYLWKDGTPRFFVESSNNKHNAVSIDGRVDFELTKEWKRYWVHYHFNTSSDHPLPEKLLIRCYRGNEVYICKPKLEIGATMTEFTERKTDLVDKASLKKAGIGITDREVLLYGEQVKVMNGNAIAALFKDGMLNADLIAAKVLESLGSNGARVSISDGIMEFFGSVNKTMPNIRFGLNSEGSAVLSYYDNNGDLLYDLGPDGISTMDKTNGSFTAYQFYTSQNLFGVSSTPSSYGTYKTFTSSHNPPSISETFLVADNSYDSHLFPSLNPSTNRKTTLYRYTAPRINGKIVADSLNGFTTQELASKADGKYFTSKAKADVVKNGNLASLAPDGDYWNVNAGVVNQGNLQPAVLKLGEYYDKPTYSRALPMSLFAGSKELGVVGKICSKETTRQWGNGIEAYP